MVGRETAGPKRAMEPGSPRPLTSNPNSDRMTGTARRSTGKKRSHQEWGDRGVLTLRGRKEGGEESQTGTMEKGGIVEGARMAAGGAGETERAIGDGWNPLKMTWRTQSALCASALTIMSSRPQSCWRAATPSVWSAWLASTSPRLSSRPCPAPCAERWPSSLAAGTCPVWETIRTSSANSLQTCSGRCPSALSAARVSWCWRTLLPTARAGLMSSACPPRVRTLRRHQAGTSS